MTREEREDARRRCELASPGPWWSGSANSCPWMRLANGPPPPGIDGSGCDDYGCAVPGPDPDNDGDFIAHSRTDLPAALDHIDKLELSRTFLFDALIDVNVMLAECRRAREELQFRVREMEARLHQSEKADRTNQPEQGK